MAKKKEVLFEFPNPIDNDCLVGHSDTLKTFMDAWNKRDEHPIHPVWMLCGPRGIGKATFAYKIAKMVYGNVGDFFIIDLAHNIDERGNDKSDAKQISVHTVRAMIEKMQMFSMSGKWRVILIDSVDELTVAAENAVLKLLEEPPQQTLFLLVTHQLSNVLPTVRSRARVEKMRPLTVSELRELCAKFLPDTEISPDILALANGSFGKIANLKASGGDIIYEDLLNILKNKNSTASDMMNIAIKIASAPALYGIVLDAIAFFNLADLYPVATKNIYDINRLNLKPDITIFKIINEIKKMFIDTHCHLTDEYQGGVDTIIQHAKDVGVGALICATAEGTDIEPALKIAESHDNIFVTTGIHPDHTNLNPYDFLTDKILNNPKVLGVGEIGLDYHYGLETRKAQIELFEKQLNIAYEHNMPVAIHTRDAEKDTVDILTNKYRGVMHCFTSSWDLAKVMLDRGFYFSASGILTFKNAETIRETFAKIPNNRIVIETDSPYCAPVPHRGKICEPAFVIETAKVLAQIKKLQIEELETILLENTQRLYTKCHVKL